VRSSRFQLADGHGRNARLASCLSALTVALIAVRLPTLTLLSLFARDAKKNIRREGNLMTVYVVGHNILHNEIPEICLMAIFEYKEDAEDYMEQQKKNPPLLDICIKTVYLD